MPSKAKTKLRPPSQRKRAAVENSSASPIPRLLATTADAKRQWLEANAPSVRNPADCFTILANGFDQSEAGLQRLVWQYVKQSPDAEAVPSGDWRSAAPAALVEMLRGPLWHLVNLASAGDRAAVAAFVELAKGVVGALEEQAKAHPQHYREHAESQFVWPTLIARKKEHNDSVRELLKSLNVGAKASDPRQLLGRIREETRGLTPLAAGLVARIMELRRDPWAYFLKHGDKGAFRLPNTDFSEAGIKEWAKAAWELLLADHNGNPLTNPALAKYGEKNVLKGQTGAVLSKRTEKNLRLKGIRDALTDAVKSLAGLNRRRERNRTKGDNVRRIE